MILNKKTALFYGIMMGDGCLSRAAGKYFISISGNIHDDRPFYDNVLGPIVEKLRGRPTRYRIRPKYGKIEFNFTDKELFSAIHKLGFPIGLKGRKLCTPPMFRGKLFKHVVAGLFSTDGCLVLTNNNGILYPRIEIQSISKKMLVQVRDFLNKNGLKGYVYKVNNGQIYRLQYNGKKNLAKFERLIGFSNPKHKAKCEKFRSRGSAKLYRVGNTKARKESRGSSVVERHFRNSR